MQFKLQGKVIHIADTKKISDKFTVREFAIEVPDGNYSEEIVFQLINDKVDMITGHGIDDDIMVHFDIKGRSYKDRWFNNLNAWKIEGVAAAIPGPEVSDIPGGSEGEMPF